MQLPIGIYRKKLKKEILTQFIFDLEHNLIYNILCEYFLNFITRVCARAQKI